MAGDFLLKRWQLLLASLFISIYFLYLTTGYSWKTSELFDNNNKHPETQLEFPQGDWQNVGHPHYEFWVYSAYAFEDEKVTIFGTPMPFESQEREEEGLVWCRFYLLGDNNSESSTSQLTVIPATIEWIRGWGEVRAGTFVHCPLQKINGTYPTFVSVLFANQTESFARLPIKYRTQNKSHIYKFAACVLPLYGYNQVFHFLEWLEYYRMMGVEHVTIHNRSLGPDTSCVVNHWNNHLFGSPITISVHPWHGYPQEHDSDIRLGYGLSAGANHCLYSYKGVAKYMAFVDLDELIVPLKGIKDFHHLLKYLEADDRSPGGKLGCFTFKNGFYFKDRAKDPELVTRCLSKLSENSNEFTACQHLWSMSYFQREPLNEWEERSKYIAVPDGSKIAGNHFVLEFEKGWRETRASSKLAFSRHYRQRTKEAEGVNRTENGGSMEERFPLEMGIILARNVAVKVKYFMNVCNFSLETVYQ